MTSQPLTPEREHRGMNGAIPLEAKAWRERGEWHLLIRAPRWIVDDMAPLGGGGRVLKHYKLGNKGGPSGSATPHSFLLVSVTETTTDT